MSLIGSDSIMLCEICEGSTWEMQYHGVVRNGSFGNKAENCTIYRCGVCGVDRLAESACKQSSFYEKVDYRNLIHEPTDAEGFIKQHDSLQIRNLQAIWPEPIRNKIVADIGCGGGSLLDHISGLVEHCVAIEPCLVYHESLKKRGYSVYPLVVDAKEEFKSKIDLAFHLSVIEHVQSPRKMLSDIKELLHPDGKLLVSTPNRNDVLMTLLGDEYKSFFYRTVHRWYFDIESFTYCARLAGFEVIKTQCVHRFELSNAMTWLRDRKPSGNDARFFLNDPILNEFWKKYLESKNLGDYLYFVLQPL